MPSNKEIETNPSPTDNFVGVMADAEDPFFHRLNYHYKGNDIKFLLEYFTSY